MSSKKNLILYFWLAFLVVVIILLTTVKIDRKTTNTDAFLSSSLDKISIYTPSSTVIALLATNDATRERGLGRVTNMGDHDGMLFAFPTPAIQGFWMKDTLIPLDMVWINGDKEVIGVSDHVLPESFPKVFYSPSPVLYVLEINSGSAEKLGIKRQAVDYFTRENKIYDSWKKSNEFFLIFFIF